MILIKAIFNYSVVIGILLNSNIETCMLFYKFY